MTVSPARRRPRRALRSNRWWRLLRLAWVHWPGSVCTILLLVGGIWVRRLTVNWWMLETRAGLLLAGFLFIGLVNRSYRKSQRRTYSQRPWTLSELKQLSPREFEELTAELCLRDGARTAKAVGGADDKAADVLAVLWDGRRVMVQCKRWATKAVDADTLYAVNGTYRDWHGCHLAVVVTTSRFTSNAREFAEHVGIHLYDGNDLERWANGTGPAPWH